MSEYYAPPNPLPSQYGPPEQVLSQYAPPEQVLSQYAPPARAAVPNVWIYVGAVLMAVVVGLVIYVAISSKASATSAASAPSPPVTPKCPPASAPAPTTSMQADPNYSKVVKQYQTHGSFVTASGDDSMNNTAIVIVGKFMTANNLTGYNVITAPANLYAVLTAPDPTVATNLITTTFPKK